MTLQLKDINDYAIKEKFLLFPLNNKNKELENLYNLPLKYSNVSIDDNGFDTSKFTLH